MEAEVPEWVKRAIEEIEPGSKEARYVLVLDEVAKGDIVVKTKVVFGSAERIELDGRVLYLPKSIPAIVVEEVYHGSELAIWYHVFLEDGWHVVKRA
jgi:hypothetical protein